MNVFYIKSAEEGLNTLPEEESKHCVKVLRMTEGPLLHGRAGGNVEIVTDFLYLGSKITVDGDRSHEIRK